LVFEKTKSPSELDFGDYHKNKSPLKTDFGLKTKSPYGVDLVVLKKQSPLKVWGGRFLFLDPHYMT
jgi:hypothetical protein